MLGTKPQDPPDQQPAPPAWQERNPWLIARYGDGADAYARVVEFERLIADHDATVRTRTAARIKANARPALSHARGRGRASHARQAGHRRASASSSASSSGDDSPSEPAEPEPPLGGTRGAVAYWYAQRLGFNVLPGRGRRPLVSWPPDGKPTGEQIAARFRRHPDADIVWLVGPRFAVVDVDVRDAFDGHDELHELERAYRPLPDTPRALTPRGGAHIVFTVPTGVTVPGEYIAPGVDVRTGRRIIALPPGPGREWEISPAELEFAELPDWVVALANAAHANGNGRATTDGESNDTGRGITLAPRERVPHGRRHYFLKGRALRFARGGIVDARELEMLLEAEFAAYCAPLPVPEPGSIRQLAKWTAKRCRVTQRERGWAQLPDDSWWKRHPERAEQDRSIQRGPIGSERTPR